MQHVLAAACMEHMMQVKLLTAALLDTEPKIYSVLCFFISTCCLLYAEGFDLLKKASCLRNCVSEHDIDAF